MSFAEHCRVTGSHGISLPEHIPPCGWIVGSHFLARRYIISKHSSGIGVKIRLHSLGTCQPWNLHSLGAIQEKNLSGEKEGKDGYPIAIMSITNICHRLCSLSTCVDTHIFRDPPAKDLWPMAIAHLDTGWAKNVTFPQNYSTWEFLWDTQKIWTMIELRGEWAVI